MIKNNDEIQMRKRNMKLYPSYTKLACDYLFYYTIDFLFLTQIKHISASDVVLITSIKSIFSILLLVPANMIVEMLGRKNSIILGNIINCIYMIMFMLSTNFFGVIMAKFLSALAVSIKNIAEPSLLNASIPPSRYKSNIFAKITAKGKSGYYILGAISKIIAGYLFAINGYLPFICSLIFLIIVTVISTFYIEPINRKNKQYNKTLVNNQFNDIKIGFKFIMKSERLKALILAASLLSGIFSISLNYRTSLLKDINISSSTIGIIGALLTFVSAIASKKQDVFSNKFKNKTLIILAFITSISDIIAGMAGLNTNYINLSLLIIMIAYIFSRIAHGMYFTIIDRYFRNFTNNKIDTKVFAVKNLFTNLCSAIMGIMASFLLSKMSTAYCMIVVGITFTILFIVTYKYMKTRVGLKPEQYSEEERKYDELKTII